MNESAPILPGPLDLLVLKAVSLGNVHGYGVLLRIEEISEGARQLGVERATWERLTRAMSTALAATPQEA